MTRALAWTVLCACLLASCASQNVAALEFEQRGCREITAEGVCELADARELVIWADAPALHASLGGARSRRVAQGTQLTLTIPKGVERLTLRAGKRQRTLRFVASAYPARLESVRSLRALGKLDEAERALDAFAETAAKDGCSFARVRSQRARLARARGREAEAEAHYLASISGLSKCGRVSEAAADGFALFYQRSEELRQFDAANKLLRELEPTLTRHAEDTAWLHYYRASLALRQGKHAAALAALDEAKARALRIELRALTSAALGMEAWILGSLGLHARSAIVTERALEALSGSDCERAAMLATAAYQRLMAVEAGQGELDPVHALLARAEALFERGCRDASLEARVLANVAQAALLQGDTLAARRALTRAESASHAHDRGLEAVLLALRGRVLAREGLHAEAQAAFEALRDHALQGGASLFEAELGRALALSAQGELEDAGEALLAAERALTHDLAQVPLSAGRESFALGRDALAHALVDTWLALGRLTDARDAARRARARVLASIPARASDPQAVATYREIERLRAEMEHDAARAWAVPESERSRAAARVEAQQRRLQALLDGLPESTAPTAQRVPVPGELLLVVFPDAHGAHLFAETVGGTEVLRMRHPGDVPVRLHALFQEAAGVTLIAPEHGPYAALDRLPVDGVPLALARPVRHALDVQVSAEARHAEGALFVLDPRGDLRAAARELPRELAPRLLFRGEQATRAALLLALKAVGRIHFAGHAAFASQHALESGLLLAGASVLTVSDVLGLASVPAHVVLSACDTARTHGAGYAGGLGLAHAFVLRGAETVVATTQPVDDETAGVFAAAFYENAGKIDERVRFHHALRALSARGLDWESYRLLVP